MQTLTMWVLLPAALLAISIQPVHATELCPFLDKVVVSVRHKPPFATVKYLDAPGGKCRVADNAGHSARGILPVKVEGKKSKESWACIWQFPKMAENAKILAIRSRLEGKREELRAAKRNESMRWKIRKKMDVRHPDYDRVLALHEDSEEEVKRVRSSIRSIKRGLNGELDRVRIEEKGKLYSEARKFVSAISSCIFEKKIRGTWDAFQDRVNFKHKVFSSGQWWVYNNPRSVGIIVIAHPATRQLHIEAWDAK